jgi:hypothetical protein
MSSRPPARIAIIYISWAENCSRSDQTARELGGKSYMVYLPKLGSHPLTVPVKYLGQFFMTLKILWREQPTAVFVMSPPLIAALPVMLFKILWRVNLVLDCHTAAFKHPRWKRLQWLQHLLERKAVTNIVHNDHLAELVRSNGANAIVVSDVPVIYSTNELYEITDRFSVAVVCSFNADEPIAEIFEAARRLPDVQFYMTGNTKHLSRALADNRPTNVKLTGFISDAAYGSLLSRASVVMSLTKRDHTMLRGAWEAIYQATPVVVSDWPCLRQAFEMGAQFADNSPTGIAAAIVQCRDDYAALRAQASAARDQRLHKWQQIKHQLLEKVCEKR